MNTKRKTIKYSILIFCVLIFQFGASSAAEEETKQDDPEAGETTAKDSNQPMITVTAERTEKEALDTPASVSVITADEIARHSAQSPEALLKSEVGVDLATTPSASVDRVVLRGIPEGYSGNTTQYLLNGMPVDAVQISTNRNPWQLVSTSDIERIEVVRGPSSSLYGANAMGGVINIITKRGSGEPFLRMGVETGSHDGQAYSLEAGGSFGDFDIRVSGRDFTSDGYRPILESSWGGSDYDLSGRNSDTRHLNGRLTWWPTENREISAGVYHYENAYNWWGGHPNYRTDSDGTGADFLYSEAFTDTAKLKFKLQTLDSAYDYSSDNSYEDIPEDPLVMEDRYRDEEQATSAELQLEFEPLSNNTLIVGGSYSVGSWELNGEEWWSDYPNWTPYSKSNKSKVYSLFIQDEMRLGGGWSLVLGGRYDSYRFYDIEVNGGDRSDIDDSVFNPRVGINYRFNKVASIYASAGTGYIPANPGLIYRSGGRWLDNPDLKPEESTSWETGLKFENAFGWLSGSLALFRTDYKDRITSVMLPGPVGTCTGPWCWQYQNIAKLRVDGVELTLKGTVAERWHPFINYTYSDAEIRENPADPLTEGNTPAYVPRHKYNVGLEYEGAQDYLVRVAGRHVSTRYWSDRHFAWTEMDGFFVTDAKFIKRFRSNGNLPAMELSLAVNNIFDEEYSEFQSELADGRNWWLELSAQF